MDDTRWTVATGNFIDGVTLTGVFLGPVDATNYAEEFCQDVDWHIVKIEPI